MKCLLRNRADFSKRGVAVPGPSTYRPLFKKTFNALRGGVASSDARDVLLDAILDEEQADRVIFSMPQIFGAAPVAVRHGRLYPLAPDRMAQLQALFPQDQVEVFMALRNPATFLPAVYGASPRDNLETFLEGVPPQEMLWSNLISNMRQAAPNVHLTLWCNEDTPLIWAQIIREMAGLEHGERIVGGFDLLGTIMSRAGMKRFRAYLKEHPVMTEMQKRRVIVAFLDKFALDEEIEEELDLPGRTPPLVEELIDLYDDDVLAIQRIPGVQMITP